VQRPCPASARPASGISATEQGVPAPVVGEEEQGVAGARGERRAPGNRRRTGPSRRSASPRRDPPAVEVHRDLLGEPLVAHRHDDLLLRDHRSTIESGFPSTIASARVAVASPDLLQLPRISASWRAGSPGSLQLRIRASSSSSRSSAPRLQLRQPVQPHHQDRLGLPLRELELGAQLLGRRVAREERMIAITSSMFSRAISSPSRTCASSSALAAPTRAAHDHLDPVVPEALQHLPQRELAGHARRPGPG
jgi:hypothetical protein